MNPPSAATVPLEESRAVGPTPSRPRSAQPVAVVTVPATLLAGTSRVAALDPVLGRSPVQRHLHHLGAFGVSKAILLLDGALDRSATECTLRKQIEELSPAVPTHLDIRVTVGTDPGEWAELTGGADCLVIQGDTIHDTRCYPLLLGAEGDTELVDGGGEASAGRKSGNGGVPVGMARRLTFNPSSLDFGVTEARRVDIRTVPEYLPDLRRHLPLAWTPIRSVADQQRASRHLFDAAQKGVLDFPARYLHPLPENALVRLLAGTPVTPNAVTILTGVLGFTATYLFSTGRQDEMGVALAIALVVNVLDGVDGKLARIRLQASRFGDRLDHFLDVTFEFSWYLAIGWGLRATGTAGNPLATGVGLIGVMLASRALSGVYKTFSGRQIHDHRAFDRGFRLVAGRRNIYVLVLVAGWLMGRLDQALLLSLWWGGVTALVYLIRSVMAWQISRRPSGS